MNDMLLKPAARTPSWWRRVNDALLLMDSDPHDYVNARLRALEQAVALLQAQIVNRTTAEASSDFTNYQPAYVAQETGNATPASPVADYPLNEDLIIDSTQSHTAEASATGSSLLVPLMFGADRP